MIVSILNSLRNKFVNSKKKTFKPKENKISSIFLVIYKIFFQVWKHNINFVNTGISYHAELFQV